MEYPHLAIPLRVENNQFAINEQDSEQEAKACVWVIVSTEKDSRPEQPEFGINDPTFETMPININGILEAIARWEPRVETEIDTIELPDGTQRLNIYVTTSGTINEEA